MVAGEVCPLERGFRADCSRTDATATGEYSSDSRPDETVARNWRIYTLMIREWPERATTTRCDAKGRSRESARHSLLLWRSCKVTPLDRRRRCGATTFPAARSILSFTARRGRNSLLRVGTFADSIPKSARNADFPPPATSINRYPARWVRPIRKLLLQLSSARYWSWNLTKRTKNFDTGKNRKGIE